MGFYGTRRNQELLKKFPADWQHGKPDADATKTLLKTLREDSWEQASDQVVESLDTPTPAELEDELKALDLLKYCRSALERRR